MLWFVTVFVPLRIVRALCDVITEADVVWRVVLVRRHIGAYVGIR